MRHTILRWTAIGLVALGLATGVAAADPLEDANVAYAAGDLPKAERLWRDLAAQGDAAAQLALAHFYLGAGTRLDYTEAANWLIRAAEQGHLPAINDLGVLFARAEGKRKKEVDTPQWSRPLADQGISADQFRMAFVYRMPVGLPPKYVEALDFMTAALPLYDVAARRDGLAAATELFRRAADQGYTVARLNLGLSYQNGEGVPQSRQDSFAWLFQAASEGNAIAQLHLGLRQRAGEGGRPNLILAARWFRMAADGGLAPAQYELARGFEAGEGVPMDIGLAARWYEQSAAGGDPFGQLALAGLYESGRGVPQDFIEAYKWYNLAVARLGPAQEAERADAARRRDDIGLKMLHEHIIQAQKLSRDWRPRQ